MSNIVIDESRILQLEEDRVTLRNNLRSQGVSCADDETLESLVAKVDDIISYTYFLNNNVSGVLINDQIEKIEDNGFLKKDKITGIYFKACTSVGTYGFNYASNIRKIVLPSLLQVLNNVWNNSFNQEIMILNNVSNIGAYQSLGGVGTLIVPRLTSSLTTQAMGGNNKSGTLIDFGKVPNTTNWTISGSTNLRKLILRKADGIVPLSATSVFNNTPFSSSNGICYVPQSLISSYESATNWSALSGTTFISIEGSRFEDLDWADDYVIDDRLAFSTCTLDGNEIDILDNETVAIFKHTENISHCYENGVELQDTDLVKGKTLTSTI